MKAQSASNFVTGRLQKDVGVAGFEYANIHFARQNCIYAIGLVAYLQLFNNCSATGPGKLIPGPIDPVPISKPPITVYAEDL